MGIKNEHINTTRFDHSKRVIVDDELFNGTIEKRTADIPLARTIVSDMQYGVGNRPTLPSCFDDDEFVKAGDIDRAVDIRRSHWDDLAAACSPVSVTKSDDTPPTPPTPPTEPIE